jgi:hypothetical protein
MKGLMVPALATAVVALFGGKVAEKIGMGDKEKLIQAALLMGLSFAPVKGLKKSPVLIGGTAVFGALALKEMGVIPGLGSWDEDLPMLEGYSDGTMQRQIGLYSGAELDRNIGAVGDDLGIQYY